MTFQAFLQEVYCVVLSTYGKLYRLPHPLKACQNQYIVNNKPLVMFWGEGQLIHNGKYKIEKHLGGGAFAVTYLALQTNLNRRVVIKTPNQNDQNNPDYVNYVKLFKKEAQMLTKCCADMHAHIVQVIELFEEDGHHCLVMLYIPGKNLWLFVQDHRELPETDAIKYIHQIGLALVEVHQKGILHLDVTPPNIMLNFDSGGVPNSAKAVLIDFGIGGDMSPRSSFSKSFGNKTFAPYELLGRGIRHPTVDVYCLAASLYYAVTGQCPTNSLERKLYNEKLVPPKELVPSLSDAVNEAILQGMALEAKDRPQTMQEWLNLLVESAQQMKLEAKDRPQTMQKWLNLLVESTQQMILRAKAGLSLLGVPLNQPAVATQVYRSPQEKLMIELRKAAEKRGGQLNVTQAVMDTGANFTEVEAVFKDLLKSGYAMIDNDPVTGAVTYHLHEFLNQPAVAAQVYRSPQQEKLMMELLKAAEKRGGQLTVRQAVRDTGANFTEVETVFKELLKSGYAGIDNDPVTGAVSYHFYELN